MGPSRSYLVIFGSIEIMLLAVNLKFIILSVYLDNIIGQIFSLFILLVAASEISIGLSILIIY
jgi:NADH-quinone oxidoreductase subunit K